MPKAVVILIILLCNYTFLTAAVTSPSGQILFDANADDVSEMNLNSTGLAIGPGLTPSSNLHVEGNAIISQQLTIGDSSGSSNLYINGSIGFSMQTMTSSSNISASSIVLADSSSGNLRCYLPSASSCEGRRYSIKKTSSLNNVYLYGGPFDDQVYLKLNSGTSALPYVSMLSASGNWHITTMSGNAQESSAANLVAWYPFNESSGTSTQDGSVNSKTGTLNNMDFSSDGSTGILDRALSFSATNDSVTADSSNVQFGSQDFSVAVWVNTASATRQFVASTYSGGGADSFYCEINSAGKPSFQLYSAGADVSGSSSILARDGTWHHVTWVFNRAGNAQFYVDGILDGTVIDISAVTSIDNANVLTIGKYQPATSITFVGSMDDLRFYNKALSQAEVRELYQLAID
jgi:hypothetical protein